MADVGGEAAKTRLIPLAEFIVEDIERLSKRVVVRFHARARPNIRNGRKSPALRVASLALQRMATAAIIQSASDRERRPVLLKRSAASVASAERNGSGFGNIRRARVSPVASNGPHRYSAHAIELISNTSPPTDHKRSWACAEEPEIVACIRKFVSK